MSTEMKTTKERVLKTTLYRLAAIAWLIIWLWVNASIMHREFQPFSLIDLGIMTWVVGGFFLLVSLLSRSRFFD